MTNKPPGGVRRLLLLGLMALGLLLIGRTTGAGWVIVLLCGLAALAVVAIAAPLLALRQIRARIEAPPDGTVGRPLPVRVTIEGRFRAGVALRLEDPATPWMNAVVPAEGQALGVPGRRGVVSHVVIGVRASGPLGLVGWRRRLMVPLSPPLEVAPAATEEKVPVLTGHGARGSEPETLLPRGGEIVRSVRDYAPGDPAKLVHWPATAHRGELMVRELEAPGRPRLALIVDLRGPAGEEAASRAMGISISALRAGLSLWMLTAEASGGVCGKVRSPIEAGRRLARAVPAPPRESGVPEGATVIWISA